MEYESRNLCRLMYIAKRKGQGHVQWGNDLFTLVVEITPLLSESSRVKLVEMFSLVLLVNY
jgi:hypothetical protein